MCLAYLTRIEIQVYTCSEYRTTQNKYSDKNIEYTVLIKIWR